VGEGGRVRGRRWAENTRRQVGKNEEREEVRNRGLEGGGKRWDR